MAVRNLPVPPIQHGEPDLDRLRQVKPPLPDLEDQLLYDRDGLRIGLFRAYPDDLHFRCSGEPGEHLIVFPQTSVWIRHHGSHRFVADRNVATLYNPDDSYERATLSRLGDHGHWFAFSRETLCEAMGTTTDDGDRLLRWPSVRTTSAIYREQASIVAGLMDAEGAKTDDPMIRARALALLDDLATHLPGHTEPGRLSEQHRQLAERARALLAENYRDDLPLDTLAQQVNCSPYHLCRVFKRCLGVTVHRYLTDLRLRRALIEIPEGGRLIDIAIELGFSSHSHFTQAFRRAFAITPASYRNRVAGAA